MKKRVLLTALCVLMCSSPTFAGANQDVNYKEIEIIQQNAFKYYTQKDYSQAIKLSNKAIKLGADTDRPYIIKIMALIGEDKNNEAAKTIDEALSLFPESSIVNLYKGSACYLSANYTTAIEYLKKSISITPSAEAYHIMALCYSELGEYEKSVECFTKEYQLPRPLDDLNKQLLEAEKLLNEKQYSKAFRLADNAASIEPTYYLPFKIRAIANLKMHHYPEAVEDIYKSIEMHQIPYPISLYKECENILYLAAYSEAPKIQPKYMKDFMEDFNEITKYHSDELDNPPQTDDGEEHLTDYFDFLTESIVSSHTEALYKINALISMMNSKEIKSRKYSNMYYYKFYATAIRIASAASDYDFKRTHTTREKVISMIKKRTTESGTDFTPDFGDYLFYKYSGNNTKAENLMKYITFMRFDKKAYDNGFLYEDDMDEVLEYVGKYENTIIKNVY